MSRFHDWWREDGELHFWSAVWILLVLGIVALSLFEFWGSR